MRHNQDDKFKKSVGDLYYRGKAIMDYEEGTDRIAALLALNAEELGVYMGTGGGSATYLPAKAQGVDALARAYTALKDFE